MNVHLSVSTKLLLLGLFMTMGGLTLSLPAASRTNAGPNLPADQLRQKYGLFVHYVWGGADKTITVNRDGSKPSSLQVLADRFDAAGFAKDLQSMGVEYVIFTAWHANMNLLYPSTAMDRWINVPDHTANRDVIQDLIQELRPRGINLYLYTHPQDGHDFTASEQAATGFNEATNNYATWNHFINDVYGNLVSRYGTNVAGYWIDCCTVKSNNHANIVDFDRLRSTIKANNASAVILETSHYAALWGMYFGHVLSKEINDPSWFDYQPVTWEISTWPGYAYHVAVVEAPTWWASVANPSTNGVKKSPEEMFRFTVFQAGVNTEGLGVAWAAGPYVGGGWEPQVRESLQALGTLIAPVADSIKGVYASTSYPTAPGTRMRDLTWGVATRSPDGKYEYLHVLRPPILKTLSLPAPNDGKRFRAARMLKNGHAVSLSQHANSGTVSLTLGKADHWDALDTVIRLTVELKPASDRNLTQPRPR